MTSETKHYCDRCGVHMVPGWRATVVPGKFNLWNYVHNMNSREWALCKGCLHAVTRFMENKV